ncbi:MAG: hypothetical protein P8Y70_12540 [Candidatus Lokiarchaeota archaeon]
MSEQADIPVVIQLFGIGKMKAIVIRHLSPLTSDAILDKLPFALRGRFNFGSKKAWILPGLGIRKGLSIRAAKKVKKGDLIYNPRSDELRIILEDYEMPNKVNKVGEVKSDLELILQAKNGLNTKIQKVR